MERKIPSVAHRDILRKTARAVALAGGITLGSVASVDSPRNYKASPTDTLFNNVPSLQPAQQTTSRDEQISELLENKYARAGLIATLGMGISMTAGAYLLGKRHDEAMLHMLRVAGPGTMTASVGSALVDSFYTIDRNIPATLFAASTLLTAGYQIINTYERYRDPKIRAAAIGTGTFFVSLGIITLLATNQ